MAVLRWILVGVMALVALASAAYAFDLLPSIGRSEQATQYYCPMHPQVVQDHPGECPICSMTLVPKGPGDKVATSGAEDQATSHAPAMAPAGAQGVPGLVPVDLGPERVQLIGIRTAAATTEKLVPEVRTVGYVSGDESKVARVHTRFSGWIQGLAVSTTGQKVRRGQVLATIYSPDLLPAQQEFLAAQKWSTQPAPRAGGSAPSIMPPLDEDARSRLEILGMSRGEIGRIAQTGKPVRGISVSAPIGGYVTRKNAVQGGYVQPGMELFEIADLSKVWVLADVYEYDIGRVAVDQEAEVSVDAYPGEPFSGKVGFIYPTVNTETRTLRVRVELANKKLKLRPGMYGNVVIRLGEAQGVVIPREALVDTGEHQYVFVAKDAGRFEPRLIRAGAVSGDKVQILQGLNAGEVVVTTANFLIDSESRLRAAIEGAPASSGPAATPAAPPSACDGEFDKVKFPDKYRQCRDCERVHRGMGSMEQDCKNAIARPWR
jgi:Cu(I)/Ag(I) efflux system membrane fusion protein